MAKSNPLFVDSTVLHGDRISTQIELTHVALYEGESVSVVLTNHLRETEDMTLKMADESSYAVRAWLSHQKPILYRFLIEKDGKTIFQSQQYDGRAQYALIERWEPELDQPVVDKPKLESTLKKSEPKPSLLRDESSRSFSEIMEKWGL